MIIHENSEVYVHGCCEIHEIPSPRLKSMIERLNREVWVYVCVCVCVCMIMCVG